MTDELRERYDVAVLGGGAAGLSGALMLARARRSVVVLDAGHPRNAPAEGVHGLLGREGMTPADLLDRGRGEVRGYGGHVVTAEVAAAERVDGGFRIRTTDGRSVTARRLLVATGVVDELPDVDGLREQWGRGVVHCPYCHGYEVRDRAIGVLGSSPMSVHQALLFRQWTEDLTFFRHRQPALTAEQAEQFAARGIRVVEGEVTALDVDAGAITGVRLGDGSVIPREVVAVSSRIRVTAPFLAGLGIQPAAHPSGMGDYVQVDDTGRTEVAGVSAAGNITDMSAQVGAAAAAGAMAGARINADLVTEETEASVAALARQRAAS